MVFHFVLQKNTHPAKNTSFILPPWLENKFDSLLNTFCYIDMSHYALVYSFCDKLHWKKKVEYEVKSHVALFLNGYVILS